MRKLHEIQQSESCLNKAAPDEWVFVLLARDPASPVAIRAWIAERIRLGKNKDRDNKILSAEMDAQVMEGYRLEKEAREKGTRGLMEEHQFNFSSCTCGKRFDNPTQRGDWIQWLDHIKQLEETIERM